MEGIPFLEYFCNGFTTQKQMKRIEVWVGVGAMTFLCACNPSRKEQEEKRIYDSIRRADSTLMVQAEQQRILDSISLAQAEAALKDSISQGWLNKDGTPTAKLRKALKSN